MSITLNGTELINYLLASIRIIFWLLLVPPFSSRSINVMAKVVLSLGLAFAAGPAMTLSIAPTQPMELAVSAATQALIGAAMGFVTYTLFIAIAQAGALIDVFGGFAMAQVFDPLSSSGATIFGNLHQQLATMLLFVSKGYLLVIGGLLKTFEAIPVGESPKLDTGPELIVGVFKVFFATAVQIALPLIAVLLLADLALALMTKVAPQLNAINVMFPVKIGLTLLLVGLSFHVLPGSVEKLVELSNEAMSTLAGRG